MAAEARPGAGEQPTSAPAPRRARVQPEAIIFTGLQGAGKSTFYRERFFATHLRISLDLLRTRRREDLLLTACLAGAIAFVVDNTNPTRDDRARYLLPARAAGFRLIGYHFDIPIATCLARNAARPQAERVPPRGIYGTRKRLQPPTYDEGFDRLYRVTLDADGAPTITELEA
jgi:predicted kinase